MMSLAAIPADAEPNSEELALHMDGLTHMPDVMRVGMASIRWRMSRVAEDPNAFLVPFATQVDGYHEYLNSALWQRIRRRVLKAANKECACCSSKATQVHHRDYRPRVLQGDDDSMLVALCRPCHEGIHTAHDGRRQSTWNEVEAELHRRIAVKAALMSATTPDEPMSEDIMNSNRQI